jgi:hypothetical protein
MSQAILFRLCRARQHAFHGVETEFESWKVESVEADMACEVDCWVQECLTIRDQTKSLYERIRRLKFANKIKNFPALGQAILQLFETALGVFTSVRESIQLVTDRGFVVEGLNDFKRAETELQQLQDSIRQRWPLFDKDMWDRTGAEYERGESQSTEEILRELQDRNSSGD